MGDVNSQFPEPFVYVLDPDAPKQLKEGAILATRRTEELDQFLARHPDLKRKNKVHEFTVSSGTSLYYCLRMAYLIPRGRRHPAAPAGARRQVGA